MQKTHAPLKATSVLLILLLLTPLCLAKRIIFYEIGAGNEYKIEGGYSEFAEQLSSEGHYLASITQGELSKEKLESYDILVIQNLRKKLTTEEVSSILWFVLQQGRGLFINGAAQGNANQLTIPFGVTIDSGTLIDTTNQLHTKSRSDFVIHQFTEPPGMTVLTEGVAEITLYGPRGFILTGESTEIAMGDNDTYSTTGSFPSGSRPPVSAAAIFGNGVIFIHTDVETLSNDHINEKNNKKYGENIIAWLGIPTNEQAGITSVGTIQNQIHRTKLMVGRLQVERDTLQAEIKTVQDQSSQIQTRINQAAEEILVLQEGKIGPLNRDSLSIIILGLCVVFAAVMISQAREPKEESEALLNELGYDVGEDDDLPNEL
ncbi:MAG: hypothetical protein GF334_13160 [Candidatus Altiarchaeales archaeon]|nr:hypothetical protein [Candidatus Altiarchaeales archaeon]